MLARPQAIKVALEYALLKNRKLGRLIVAHRYDKEDLKTCDIRIRKLLTDSWVVIFALHADYSPLVNEAQRRSGDRISFLALNESETFVVHSISAKVTEHRRPWSLWFRRCWQLATALFERK